MVYRVLIFIFRKPGTTPDEFKIHYEKSHLPLVKSIGRSLLPISHNRYYIKRSKVSEPANEQQKTHYPASVLIGVQADFDYDVISELVFEDEAAFLSFFSHVTTPENAAQIAANEEVFLDRARLRMVVVGETLNWTSIRTTV